MKPCSRKAKGGFVFLSGDYNRSFGSDKTVAIVSGAVKLKGVAYTNVLIYVYNTGDMSLITILTPVADGSFRLRGVNRDMRLTMVCVDRASAVAPTAHHKVKPE